MAEDEDALCTICDFGERWNCTREFHTRAMFQYGRAEASVLPKATVNRRQHSLNPSFQTMKNRTFIEKTTISHSHSKDLSIQS